MKRLKRSDIISPLVIGEIIAIISIVVLRYSPIFNSSVPPAVLSASFLFPFVFPIVSLIGVYVSKLISVKIPVFFQFAKFVLVGASNTFVDLGILNILMLISEIFAGTIYSFFKGFSFICSIVNSYFWNKFWTFEKKETKVGIGEFGKFALVAGIGFLLNIGIASFIVNLIGPQFGISEEIWANIGAFIAILCVFMWNFLGYKIFVFKK